MKPLFYIIVILLVVSCKKETETKTVEKEVIKTNTVIKKCKMLESVVYDTFGNISSKSVYYYTGNTLDSLLTYSTNDKHVYTLKYEYLSANTRKSYYSFFYNGTPNNGYTIQTLNEFGEVIESKSYDNNNRQSSTIKWTFDCN